MVIQGAKLPGESNHIHTESFDETGGPDKDAYPLKKIDKGIHETSLVYGSKLRGFLLNMCPINKPFGFALQ